MIIVSSIKKNPRFRKPTDNNIPLVEGHQLSSLIFKPLFKPPPTTGDKKVLQLIYIYI